MAQVDLDDWEGRLAALAAGKRYRAPTAPRTARQATPPDALSPESELLSILLEPCPCDRCSLRQLCATRELACRRYALFLQGRSVEHWESAARTPTRELFAHLGLADRS